MVGAAVTAESAEWVGGWADALITVSRPPEELEPVVEAFRRGGGEGKPMFLKVQLSYADTEEAARTGAHDQWRTNVFESHVLTELRLPEQFDDASKFVKPEDLDPFVRISSEPEQHAEWLRADLELGFERLFLHNVNRNQERYVDVFGERVIPLLRG
jgi:alkanesulfonate monooxygenase SsuD/methylene tetrahydromethanopterin reductase-like flavin-dependent oxidoreductase (luciferase family)